MLAKLFAFLHRYRFAIAGAWLIHTFLIHLLLIGFVSWDGYSYRVPPEIELVQHGSFGFDKYNQWAFKGYFPFVELVHAPFLAVFKLAGIIIGFPLIVFPLCVWAIYLFVQEVTGDRKCAVFGAVAYVAMPVNSQQPYSGHIDFAVVALFAYLLYAIFRADRELTTATQETKSARSFIVRIAIATVLLTLTRTTTIFLIGFFFPFVAYVLFFVHDKEKTKEKWKLFHLHLSKTKRRVLMIAIAGIAIGAIPAIGIQIYKLAMYGSPIYPYQFQLFGVKIGQGVSSKDLFFYAGLADETPSAFFKSFVSGWVWPGWWPPGLLSDSRCFGVGLMFYPIVAAVPFWFKTATRREKWLIVTCILVSLFARDWWLPRWAYTLNIALTLILARTMGELAARLTDEAARKTKVTLAGRAVFWGVMAMLIAHLGRPEFDLYLLDKGIGPRLDTINSPFFVKGPDILENFPDVNARFVIVEFTWNGFLLPIYGRRLTNTVLYTIAKNRIGEKCSTLIDIQQKDPAITFIDDGDATKDCPRECVLRLSSGWCRGYRMLPPAASTAMSEAQ